MAGARFDLEPSISALLRDLGVAPARVLRRAGLPGDLLSRRPTELSVPEYYSFWNAVEAETPDASAEEVAVRIGRAISVEMFSPPVFAALCSRDLGSAAQRLAEHKPLIGPVRLDVQREDDLRLAYVWPDSHEVPRLLAVTELVFWVTLARIATRAHVRRASVEVPGRPDDRAALEDFLGARVRAGHDYAVTFTGVDAERPFLTENEPMWRVFAPHLRERLSDLASGATVADRVRAALRETLPAGDASIAGVTRHLATSSRTLQRQLRVEGTSFQHVLAGTREDLARHYLASSDLRIQEIAYLLGYEETSSFYRAFRAWTGSTPEAVRGGAAVLGSEPRSVGKAVDDGACRTKQRLGQ